MIDMTLKNYKDKIDMRLDILLGETESNYKTVVESARYSLFAGGKRIRPVLLLEFYKLFGGEDDCAYNFACAVEMIHTYSLIHDDLPCMDNDDMRRGKPSNHKKYGETTALLAGDALLTESFGVAARTIGIKSDYLVKAMAYLSANAGISGMIGGQVIDTLGEYETTEELLYEIYNLKTAALIKTACVCGAILGGASEEEQKKVALFAQKLGIAFQIIDDILDREGTEEKLGKPIGSDLKNQKITIVDILGIEECRKRAKDLTDEAMLILDSFEKDSTVIKEITEYLLVRDY
ncbi:MAG: polyprenyl synthetase family protein [Clostridia bacterium]|nr:polyprenyl synthetase family protein [Clostridia bacterium]